MLISGLDLWFNTAMIISGLDLQPRSMIWYCRYHNLSLRSSLALPFTTTTSPLPSPSPPPLLPCPPLPFTTTTSPLLSPPLPPPFLLPSWIIAYLYVSPSSANLSDTYFTDRQDRYIMLRNAAPVVDFFESLVDVVASLSFEIDASSSDLRPPHDLHPFEG